MDSTDLLCLLHYRLGLVTGGVHRAMASKTKGQSDEALEETVVHLRELHAALQLLRPDQGTDALRASGRAQ